MQRMTFRSLLVTGAVGLLTMSIASCGGSDSGADSPATLPADIGLEVDAGPGLKFGSESYTASAGRQTVALVNVDTQLHSMVIVDAGKKTLPGELKVGKSGDIDTGTYDLQPGTYQLLCLVPGHDNMKATLTVG